jgi:FkbM family methyltransferase
MNLRTRRKKVLDETNTTASYKPKNKSILPRVALWCVAGTIVLWVITHIGGSNSFDAHSYLLPDSVAHSYSLPDSVPCSSSKEAVEIESNDETCKSLPVIRPTCEFDIDNKIDKAVSQEGLDPKFAVGSYYAEKASYHMNDRDNFSLIKEFIHGRTEKGGIALDFGANQGFYTYYLATLGLDVHSFEINERNFKCLQHGVDFNPKEISDRVNLYRVGVGDINGRFSMRGSDYEGYLKLDSKNGQILGTKIDCFVDHMKGHLDLSKIAFIKLDVEGFEIAVLKGGQNSLFKLGHSTIETMIMEVGPNRWDRASISFETGVEEMVKLSKLFKTSYLLARASGSHTKTCPGSLGDVLKDKDPRAVGGLRVFKIQRDEWGDLMKVMKEKGFDCNFFYENK